MLKIVNQHGFLGEQFLPDGKDRALGVKQFQIAQGGGIEVAPEGSEQFVAHGADEVRLAGPVRAAEHEQAGGLVRVAERPVGGPEDGPAGNVAGEAQGPFVLAVADEGVEGPLFPEGRGVAHGGMDAVGLPFLAGNRFGDGGRRHGKGLAAVGDDEPLAPQFAGFFFKAFLEQAGEADAEERVRETDAQGVRFLNERDVEGIEPALQRGFRAEVQRFARGGKPVLQLRFRAFGVGEAGEQGRSGFGERFGGRREEVVA